MVTVQVVAVPVHPFDQPVKLYPVSGLAVSVIEVADTKLAEQVAPQLMPAGALVIVPFPVLGYQLKLGQNVGWVECFSQPNMIQ
jgi:hypothetical protein